LASPAHKLLTIVVTFISAEWACAASDDFVHGTRPEAAAGREADGSDASLRADASGAAGSLGSFDGGDALGAGAANPAGPGDVTLDVAAGEAGPVGDAACAAIALAAEPVARPVDIVWVVDNSVSMKPAILELTQGLNAFAELISQKGIDYRVILLSLRSKEPEITVLGSPRYAVCIPPPLAGDDLCANGPRFFQSSIDIRSQQTLEQTLGTLGQTAGYRQGEDRGGESWRGWLRPNATRSVVMVSDDDSRFGADEFEHFAGGKNPYNSNDLPPGLLEPFWQGLFDGYVFNAIYGWGSESDGSVRCEYPSGSLAPSSGATYTELVRRTGGVRAKICDGASAWGALFEGVAQAAVEQSVRCELALPASSSAVIDFGRVDVTIRGESGVVMLERVAGIADCNASGGWYYDDAVAPSHIVLCAASCELAQGEVRSDGGSIDVVFACATIVR
jgi:hypothetical protein